MKTLKETIDEAILKWYNEEHSHGIVDNLIWSDTEFHHLTEEELVIGSFNCNGKFNIAVYGDEGNIPHFHFQAANKEGCIEIKTLKPFVHGKHRGILTRKEFKELQKWLNLSTKKKDLKDKQTMN